MNDLGESAAFVEIVSDPYDEWEEESGLDFDVKLNTMPCSSQEMACAISHEDEDKNVNMLHELDSAEATDVECDDLLEDIFVLPAESGEADDLIIETMDVACNRWHTSEELSNEAISFIANPKNKKSAKIHSRHKNQHTKC